MLVAEHLERGAEPARAALWYRRASEEALAGNDFSGALARADRAMQCGAEGDTKGALHLVRCDAHAWMSDHAASLVEASSAAEIFPKASEPWFKAVGRITLECRRLGRVDDVGGLGRSTSRELARRRGDPSGRDGRRMSRGRHALSFGEPTIGSSLIDRVEKHLAREKAPDPFVLGHCIGSAGYASTFTSAIPRRWPRGSRKSIAAFDEAGDTRNACVQRANRGFSLLPLGDYVEGERELREAMEIASRLGLLTLVSVCEHNLGTALGRLGRIEEALAAERAAVDSFARQKDVRLEAASQSHLAALELDAGSPEEAKREAERAALSREVSRGYPRACARDARAHSSRNARARSRDARGGRRAKASPRARRARRLRRARATGVRRGARCDGKERGSALRQSRMHAKGSWSGRIASRRRVGVRRSSRCANARAR